jgi:hypothetical protein
MIFFVTGHKLLDIQAESAHIQTAHSAGERQREGEKDHNKSG